MISLKKREEVSDHFDGCKVVDFHDQFVICILDFPTFRRNENSSIIEEEIDFLVGVLDVLDEVINGFIIC